MISLSEFYQGRDEKFPKELTIELQKNADKMVARASELLSAFGEKRKVTSGWRPASINAATPGAAKKSLHMFCLAVDLEDKDGRLGKWCVENVERLIEIGLWLESPTKTPGWVHVQAHAPRSGSRIFMP